MARQTDEQHNDPVVAAIERVLKTERDGVETLRRSEEEARDLLTKARAQAAIIARRADHCIAKLHSAHLGKIQQSIQALTSAHAAGAGHDDGGYDRAALVEAARRVAAKLTGGT